MSVRPTSDSSSSTPVLSEYVSEESLQAAVIDLAHLLGWMVHHDRPVRVGPDRVITPVQGDVGFPDLVFAPLLRRLPERKSFVVELKTEKGVLSEMQALWLRGLDRSYIWQPVDWHRGYVERFLSTKSEKKATEIASEAGWFRDPDDYRFGLGR